jgi:curved DNA-binding protein CbpA
MINLYEILELDPKCTFEDIRYAYKVKAMQYHPDRIGPNDQFDRVFKAYTILIDPPARFKYDILFNYHHSQQGFDESAKVQTGTYYHDDIDPAQFKSVGYAFGIVEIYS